MSRIGKLPVQILDGVTVNVAAERITVKGPLGSLECKLPDPIKAEVKDGKVRFTVKEGFEDVSALWGLSRSLVNNMINGAKNGYNRTMQISGVGYKVEMKGIDLQFSLGFTGPVDFSLPKGIKAEIDPKSKGTILKISGCDKELVGRVCSQIRKLRPPEPYQGKGIKYADEIIKRKVGKTATAAGTA